VDALSAIIRESLVVAAILCFPILAIATLVGTAIAVVQAATQVQEQTLALLPKMIAVVATIGLFGGFAMHLCASLFERTIASVPAIVAGR
jgi:flagellar biosynthetic protein FliQ